MDGSDVDVEMQADDERAGGTRLPVEALSPDALRGLVEEFVTRDGTDYGAVERGVEEKIRDVLAQLEAGEAHIVFDPDTETANIVPTRDVKQT